MRIRWSMIVIALVATTLVGGPSFAHHDLDNSKYQTPMHEQSEAFEGVAAKAAEGSNAPMSFTPCKGGMAGDFPCDGIDLMSFIPHEDLGTTFVNDVWGWTDPMTKRDYGLVGAGEGTVFVDITDPRRPDVLGILPSHTTNFFFWRDIKVFENHAFVVSEDSGHGMQIFDLTELRDWDGTYTTYSATAHYEEFGRAHNIAINEDTGFAYVVGAREGEGCDFGLHMIDISDPTDPEFAGCYGENGYVHDTQCVIYAGPDTRYQGNEICFNSNAPGEFMGEDHWVEVVDVTDKDNPVSLSRETYPQAGYSHQGWLTPDQQYFLHGDEGDELAHEIDTTTRIWDVRDLENIELIGTFHNDTESIDHNLYTKGRLVFASNYSSGLRVYDARQVAAGELSELAYFDVYPEDDDPHFDGGTWSNYPYFRQKNVVGVGSMDRGYFVLRVRTGLQNN